MNFTNESPMCPKCGGEMELGELRNDHPPVFRPASISTFAFPKFVSVQRANACVQCGYVEFFLNAADLRAILGLDELAP